MFKSTNPAFATHAFENFDYAAPRAATMSVQGTVSKTFLLLGILSATAIWSWSQASSESMNQGIILTTGIAGLILGVITSFKPAIAPWTAPVYAALEGVLLGGVSQLVEAHTYPGIAMQAVGLTTGTLFIMLALYSTRVIRVTEKLRAGIYSALGALMLFYLVTFVLRLCGIPLMSRNLGMVGVLFSLFVVGLAAFCLLLDFDMIEEGARQGAPKSLEWYGAFGLIVSLVWLYFQVLRLLMRLYSDRR